MEDVTRCSDDLNEHLIARLEDKLEERMIDLDDEMALLLMALRRLRSDDRDVREDAIQESALLLEDEPCLL